MQEDEEGFLFPVIDADKCVECGLCVKRCPELNTHDFHVTRKRPEVYALISGKYAAYSSSGGAFSAIASYILNNNGVVFGATIDENGKLVDIQQRLDLVLQQQNNSYKQIESLISTITQLHLTISRLERKNQDLQSLLK